MKVTLVNHSDIVGGASMVSLRLLDALRSQGIDARMVVKEARGLPHEAISSLGGGLAARAAFVGERLRIFTANGFRRDTLFKVSVADRGLPVYRHLWIADADIVALNWFNQGMMSLDGVRRIAALGKPIVWTMHDMWPMTGICHHAGLCDRFTDRCGRCPFLGRPSRCRDLSSRIFDRKMKLYNAVDIRFVAVSRWLAGQAARSALLAGRHVEVINNAFPLDRYPVKPTLSRRALGLPDDGRRLVVMCAARLDDSIKNLPAAIDALNLYEGSTPIAAVFCGDIRRPELLDSLKIPYVSLGNITDADRLAQIYAHSDVVLSSSSFESLPSTLIEGMAAGAVPVGFGGDGRDEIIDHLSTGYLARRGDCADMAAGIKWAIGAETSREILHKAAAARFDSVLIARRYIDLFNKILAK